MPELGARRSWLSRCPRLWWSRCTSAIIPRRLRRGAARGDASSGIELSNGDGREPRAEVTRRIARSARSKAAPRRDLKSDGRRRRRRPAAARAIRGDPTNVLSPVIGVWKDKRVQCNYLGLNRADRWDSRQIYCDDAARACTLARFPAARGRVASAKNARAFSAVPRPPPPPRLLPTCLNEVRDLISLKGRRSITVLIVPGRGGGRGGFLVVWSATFSKDWKNLNVWTYYSSELLKVPNVMYPECERKKSLSRSLEVTSFT